MHQSLPMHPAVTKISIYDIIWNVQPLLQKQLSTSAILRRFRRTIVEGEPVACS